MDQPAQGLAQGTRIRTHAVLGSTSGMMIHPRHLSARRPNLPGTVGGWVPGHGGDVYWVMHEGVDDVAAYCFSEFELEPTERSTRIDIILEATNDD